MPKSMIFSPPVDSIRMFWGLMSRWMTPTSWAAASPAQICLAIRRPTGVGEDVARLDQLLQGQALDELHRDVAQPARIAEVVRAEDVGVRDPPGEPDLLLEAVEERRIRRERLAAQGLDRDRVVEVAVVRAVDDAHAALAQDRPGSRSGRRRGGRPRAPRPRRSAARSAGRRRPSRRTRCPCSRSARRRTARARPSRAAPRASRGTIARGSRSRPATRAAAQAGRGCRRARPPSRAPGGRRGP